MLTDDAIQKIADLAETVTHEIDGRTLSSKPMFNLPMPDEPRYPTIQLTTLAGLVEFVEKNKLASPESHPTHIVIEATRVSYSGPPFGTNRQRDTFATVSCQVAPFHFGQYTDLESFRVMLLSRFELSPDRQAILEFISKLTDESIKTLTDSGVTQTTSMRVGIATMGTTAVPSPCRLQPIRTFVEIEQPEGVFIFRLRKGNQGPEAALFEIFTDWERIAVQRIKAHLDGYPELSGVPIYA